MIIAAVTQILQLPQRNYKFSICNFFYLHLMHAGETRKIIKFKNEDGLINKRN